MARENDGKYYLNILETLPDGRYRHWLNIGFASCDKDFYIFDPRTSKEVHISHHKDGNVHIRHNKWENKIQLFKNEWLENKTPDFLKQVVYFRPSGIESFPILSKPPSTSRTENFCFKFHFTEDCITGPFPNIVFKVLLGPSTSERLKYRDFHAINGTHDFEKIIHNEFWSIAITSLLLEERPISDTGTFIWVFNTDEDIHDAQLFSADFQPKQKISKEPFFVNHANFNQGEVVCIYYKL
jgi:hypothetical protein